MGDGSMCWDSCPNRHRLAVLPAGVASVLDTRRQVARTLLWMLATGVQPSPLALLEQAFDAGFDAGTVWQEGRASRAT